MATTIKLVSLEWEQGSDETTAGWWYEVEGRGCSDILEGSLTADARREDVLRAVARKLGVDAVEVSS